MARSKTLRIPLRIVFYREDDAWVAHCLEFDLMGDGPTKRMAIERLGQAISLQIQFTLDHDNPANLLTPADGKYLEMFAAGKDIAAGMVEIELILERLRSTPMIDGIEAREYEDSDAALALA